VNTRILLNEFEYFEPKTVSDAIALLAKNRGKAKLIAGGTDLLVEMKNGKIKPKCLVSIMKISNLNYIVTDKNKTRIGAGTTFQEIEESKLIRDRYPSFIEAVRSMGTAQVRCMATLSGNICNASPAAEAPVALLSLSAKVKISGIRGDRVVPLEEFFVGPGKTALLPDELLTEVQIPSPPKMAGCAFLKISRVVADVSKVNAAAMIERAGDKLKSCKIALGAVSPTPIRAKKAEEILKGKKFDEETIKAAARVASEEIKPITDIRSTAEYRKEVSRVLVEKVLRRAWERAGG